MNAEACVRDTQSALRGLEKEEKILTIGIRKAFAGKKTLAINLGLWTALGCMASRVGGRARSGRAEDENAPLGSSLAQPGPAGSRWQ